MNRWIAFPGIAPQFIHLFTINKESFLKNALYGQVFLENMSKSTIAHTLFSARGGAYLSQLPPWGVHTVAPGIVCNYSANASLPLQTVKNCCGCT